jgi:hypothetical protein
LRGELHQKGVEIVTVAMDTRGSEACGKYIDQAEPKHPSLIDEAHVVGELFGIVNVPSGVWIDEEGVIVRPPEPAWARDQEYSRIEIPEDASPEMIERINLVRRLRIEGDIYLAAVRDWAENGAASKYALSPDEVVRRSHPRPREVAMATAHFEIGQHLHRIGFADDAIPHFREAHRLQPENWTYKRQAWNLVDRTQRQTEVYEGNWLKDVKASGPENYYPPFRP